jgi:thiamine biosynthesis lipoprotein
MSAPEVQRGTFRAMSTDIEITGVGIDHTEHEAALAYAHALAESWEERFSRFRPGSLLCRVNAASGAPTEVDATFIDVLAKAAAVERSEGRFDPSILPALEAAGYDQSIEMVRGRVEWVPGTAVRAAGVAAWRSVTIDRAACTVALPPGMRIDLGGIAKGAFVDAVAAQLAHWPGGAVDAGGDLRVWGLPPSGDTWAVGIEDPRRPEATLGVVRIVDPRWDGVATSAMNRRHWRTNTGEGHHLIDPATGRPVATPLAAVTAFAPTTAEAEIATKAILVASTDASARLDLIDSEWAALVDRDGHLTILQKGAEHAVTTAATRRA